MRLAARSVLLGSTVRFVLPILALAACVDPPARPGELVVSNIYQDLGQQLTIADDHVFWGIQTTVYAGNTEVFCGDLADLPLYSDPSIAIVDTVFATARDQVLVSSARDIGLLACNGGFTHLTTAVRPVQVLAYDPGSGDIAWGMASIDGFSATVAWLHDSTLHTIEIPVAIAVGSLVFHGPSLFASLAGTQDGYLMRFDVATGAQTQLATANAQRTRFPPQGLDRGPPRFSAGQVIPDEHGIAWTVLRRDDVADNERSIVIGFADGSDASTLLVVNLWGTTRAQIHDGTLYWVERSSDPGTHFPSPYFHAAIWTAPATGGDASYFRPAWGPTDIQLDRIIGDHVYGFYAGQDPSHGDARRVPLTEFVAVPPPSRDCSATPCY